MTQCKKTTALMLCLAAFGSDLVAAQNLILNRATDGSTIVSYPLVTSASCVPTAAGAIEVHPQPSAGIAGDGWCPQGVAPTAPTFPGPLSVTPTAITAGGSVTASWSSAGATSCTGTATRNGQGISVGGWTGTRSTSGNAFSITLATAGSYVFTITCSNTVGSTPSISSTVTVTDGGTPGCGGVVPIGGITRQTSFVNNAGLQGNQELGSGTIQATDYLHIFGNGTVTQFPSRVGQGTLPVLSGKYIALKFNTGTVSSATYGIGPPNPNRFGTFVWAPPGQNEGLPLVTVSLCPGDFVNVPSPLCRVQSSDGGMSWGVNTTATTTCRLQENTDYYLNVTYRNFNSPSTSTCPFSSCNWFMAPR